MNALAEDPVLTIPEVSLYLKISKSKLYYMVSKKQIPHIRIGRNVRIRQSDLLKWLQQRIEQIK